MADLGSSNPIPLARGFLKRLRGLGPDPTVGSTLMLRTRSVHTFGLRTPISITAIDKTGRVIDAQIVHPNRLYLNRRARWVLEGVGTRPLPIGSRVANPS